MQEICVIFIMDNKVSDTDWDDVYVHVHFVYKYEVL